MELNTLTFFVNTLKDELLKTYTRVAYFNFYFKCNVSQVAEYVQRFLFKLKNRGKVKEPFS